MRNKFFRLSLFYTLAITYNYLLQQEIFFTRSAVNGLKSYQLLLFSPLLCLGNLIGGIIGLYLLSKKRKLNYSLGGVSLKWSLIFVAIPCLVVGFFGADSANGENSHLLGLTMSIGLLIYSFCEEIGWRGYLQDELKSIKDWQRVLVIGFLWYLWHLSLLKTGFDIWNELRFIGLLLLGSFGLGKVIDSTKSILVVSGFHMIINLAMLNPFLGNKLSGMEKIIVVGMTFLAFFLIKKFFERRKDNGIVNEFS